MTEDLTVYEPGDRFATITAKGSVHVFEVDWTGVPINADLRPPAALPLREEDLKFSYFHVKSDPVHHGPRGVSIEHLPTGTVAEAWNEKSQLENKAQALQALRLALEDSDDDS